MFSINKMTIFKLVNKKTKFEKDLWSHPPPAAVEAKARGIFEVVFVEWPRKIEAMRKAPNF